MIRRLLSTLLDHAGPILFGARQWARATRINPEHEPEPVS